ncbi:MAG: hypothetical protein QOI84_773, partial [Solirubrobacterales bacterium]|nr:hypothetical protein [Solirubrobacterales bacterium]
WSTIEYLEARLGSIEQVMRVVP